MRISEQALEPVVPLEVQAPAVWPSCQLPSTTPDWWCFPDRRKGCTSGGEWKRWCPIINITRCRTLHGECLEIQDRVPVAIGNEQVWMGDLLNCSTGLDCKTGC